MNFCRVQEVQSGTWSVRSGIRPVQAGFAAGANRLRGRCKPASRLVQVVLVAVALLVVLPATAPAQFGHPLKGAWSGQWGPKDNPSRLLLDIEWDGKELTGKINPGTGSEGSVKKVTIDYSPVESWKVQMEGEVKDGGKVVPVRVDGTLENLGAYYKVFHGTWTQGTRKGEFTVTRN